MSYKKCKKRHEIMKNLIETIYRKYLQNINAWNGSFIDLTFKVAGTATEYMDAT
jgi:hypothetical protein